MKINKNNILNNKSIIILMTLLFSLWILFFDQNSYLDLQRLNIDLEDMKTEKEVYKRRIIEDSIVISNINNSSFLERYAREHFYMLKDGETIYIVGAVDSTLYQWSK